MATPIRKLINRTDILRELTEVVTPLYYPNLWPKPHKFVRYADGVDV